MCGVTFIFVDQISTYGMIVLMGGNGTPFDSDRGFTSCGPFPLNIMHKYITSSYILYDQIRIEHYFKSYLNCFIYDDNYKYGREIIEILPRKPILTQEFNTNYFINLISEYNTDIPKNIFDLNSKLILVINCQDKIFFKDQINVKFNVQTSLQPSKKLVKIEITTYINGIYLLPLKIFEKIDNFNISYDNQSNFSLYPTEEGQKAINFVRISMKVFDPITGIFKTDYKTVNIIKFRIEVINYMQMELKDESIIGVRFKNILSRILEYLFIIVQIGKSTFQKVWYQNIEPYSKLKFLIKTTEKVLIFRNKTKISERIYLNIKSDLYHNDVCAEVKYMDFNLD
ncbi:LOW QUALITY PROTEIN: hypothetical protein MXB_734, partial [Myxobolus squamalis]